MGKRIGEVMGRSALLADDAEMLYLLTLDNSTIRVEHTKITPTTRTRFTNLLHPRHLYHSTSRLSTPPSSLPTIQAL